MHEIESVNDRELEEECEHREGDEGARVGRRTPVDEVGGTFVGVRPQVAEQRIDGEASPEREKRGPEEDRSQRDGAAVFGEENARVQARAHDERQDLAEPGVPSDEQAEEAQEGDDESEGRFVGVRRHEEHRKDARLRRLPEDGVIREQPIVRIEIADPRDAPQEVHDQDDGEDDSAERHAAAVDGEIRARQRAAKVPGVHDWFDCILHGPGDRSASEWTYGVVATTWPATMTRCVFATPHGAAMAYSWGKSQTTRSARAPGRKTPRSPRWRAAAA